MKKPPPPLPASAIPKGYDEFLRGLKQRIQQARLKAVLAVNRELILFYWQLGRDILERQDRAGWGTKIVDRLSEDLRREFPDQKGFSRTNLLCMRAFAEAWPDEAIVQQLVAQIPWGHNVRILDMVKDPEERLWYVQQAIRNGWSRNVLVLQIEGGLCRRQGKALTNFQATLPAPQSDLAQQLIKDPYNFDFLTLGAEAQERDLERGLLAHLRQFLVELGVGFACVGSQVPLLPLRRRRPSPPCRRQAEHRPYPVQSQEPDRGGICPQEHRDADGHLRVSASGKIAPGS
jgi:predicted nuclease of restriction endonuclease-like (RecB) superfamily